MARTVNKEAFNSKRLEILNAAQRLVFSKGYEQMSIQDVLELAGISSGAFHHYFGSRQALLEAVIQGMQREAEKPLLPILHDPHLSAVEKLQGYFDALDRLRMANRADLARLLQVWYTDDNALVRLKVDEAIFEQRAPLMAEIVRQGIREGVFTSAYPDQTGEVIMSLLQGMSNTHARLMLAILQGSDAEAGSEAADIVAAIVAFHAAYMDAIERVLGAPPNSLIRTDAAAVGVWLRAV